MRLTRISGEQRKLDGCGSARRGTAESGGAPLRALHERGNSKVRSKMCQEVVVPCAQGTTASLTVGDEFGINSYGEDEVAAALGMVELGFGFWPAVRLKNRMWVRGGAFFAFPLSTRPMAGRQRGDPTHGGQQELNHQLEK